MRTSTFAETLRDRENIIGFFRDGKPAAEDLKRMNVLPHEGRRRPTNQACSSTSPGVEGHEDLAALPEDTRMDTAHREDFSRSAANGFTR